MLTLTVLLIFAISRCQTLVVVGDVGCSKNTLSLVTVVFRHGDRTPDESYPTDPYKDHTYYPVGIGRLTPPGEQRAFKVGKLLRERYDHYFGPDYYYKNLMAVSSAKSRCKMSMQEVLAGLYPADIKRKSCFDWKPVDYDYIPAHEDHLITTYVNCLAMLDVTITNTSHMCPELQMVENIVANYSGQTITKISEIYSVRDSLSCQEDFGLEIPEWVSPIWPEPLTRCAMDMWSAMCDNKTALSYAVGNLFKEILEDSYKKSNGSEEFKEVKLKLYSGHDLNIVGLLGAMGLYYGQQITYSEYLIFELHQIGIISGLRVFHQDYKGTGLHLLNIPNCGTFCPLDKFYELIQPLFPIDWCKF